MMSKCCLWVTVALTSGADRENAGNARVDQVVDHLFHFFIIDRIMKVLGIVVLKGRKEGGKNPAKLRSVCNLHK